MTPRSFFAIVIKLMGIYVLLNNIYLIPQIYSTFETLHLMKYDDKHLILSILYFVLLIGTYILIIACCLFKTNWIIDKLALDKHFEEEKFELNIHHTTVMSIAIIVIGGVIFIDSLPILIKVLYTYIGEGQWIPRIGEVPNVGWLIYYVIKIIIGCFLMIKHRMIVDLIERKRKVKDKVEETEIQNEEQSE